MSVHDKILDLDDLRAELDRIRDSRRIVHCHGTFDIMHLGHIRHFRKARELGDVLVVTVTPDRFVNKGPHRPMFTAEHRAEVLASLAEIDYVAVNRWPTAVETIALLRPHVYVKGDEYRQAENDVTGKIVDEQQAVEAVGGEIRYTEDIVFSSSNIINRTMSPFSEEVQAWLLDFSSRHDSRSILEALERMRSLRVLALGETIVDEYHFCETLGKSGKEPVLVAKCLHKERYAGGILAVANHLAAFADRVSLLSQVGGQNPQLDFIRESLRPNVEQDFQEVPHGVTLVKRRFVERYPFQKLFETYTMNGNEYDPVHSVRFRQRLEEILPEMDLVVVADYGHGLIHPDTAELLEEKARFLAINTQMNAGNQGYHAYSKYRRADLISISENELRMEARSRTATVEELILRAAERANCERIVITQGERGCLCWSAAEGFFRVPAFTTKVVDRIGAGDTVLSVVSLCGALGLPIEVAGFLGSVAGAEAVATVCNKKFLDKVGFQKSVVSLLK
ncbi:D-beta-D-heptose 1-phosphate adenylyltransferase [Fundidesulfovibrio magnetotacticus]|uniref:D-beta-D-heptose 1-phosphate adenylyltransferase n=1 Tax=Fundidesulfovibrio magnetotacticus TaxID=2730080 RepID=A0A6V8LYT8_9BACT|nr:PfkB family carbohydrate kinase [Fundidesulfovibrio magnetotacticus]GFK94956.1 D-beta-D-heptose 1-phosphate adenylyltransferase [Fundidesulfovibrio magnetotacticus]